MDVNNPLKMVLIGIDPYPRADCVFGCLPVKKKKSQRRIDFWAPAAPLQIVAPPPLILTYPSSGPQCVASNSAGFRKTPGGGFNEEYTENM